jgi:predicted RNA binding protein YcfA (HicA-like mRNA interferase family)
MASSREICRKLEQDGWVLDRQSGSHRQYKHPAKPGLVTVPHPVKDIPVGTLRNIYRQAGWPWPP